MFINYYFHLSIAYLSEKTHHKSILIDLFCEVTTLIRAPLQFMIFEAEKRPSYVKITKKFIEYHAMSLSKELLYVLPVIILLK